MQYGIELETYKRIEKIKEKRGAILENEHFKILGIILMAFLLSRVTLYVGLGDETGVSPFGIAYIIAIMIKGREKEGIIASIAVLSGYITINSNLTNIATYLLTIIVILSVNLLTVRYYKPIKEKQFFALVFGVNLITAMLFTNYSLGVNFSLAIINIAIIIPIYYITKYGVNCLEQVNQDYFFTQEEMVSVAILLCLMVSGIGELNIAGVYAKNIIAILAVILISYIGGGTYGTAIGAAMGIVIGITSSNMITYIAYYSAVGLIVGIFKETGRMIAFLAAMVMYFGLAIYSKELAFGGVVEYVLAGIGFLLIPTSVIKSIEDEIDIGKKAEVINTNKFSEIKEEFGGRVEKLGEALSVISKTLQVIGSNNKLLYKGRSTALVEGVADRVCSECTRCKLCWDREFTQTYNSFMFMIKTCEDGEFLFPQILQDKCNKKLKLKKATEESVRNLNIQEERRAKLEEGRILLSNHVKNVANSLDKMVMDFKGDIVVATDLERKIKKGLKKGGINFEQVFCYLDKNGRNKIKIKFNDCIEGEYSLKRVVEIINTMVQNPMMVNEGLSSINPDTGVYTVIIEEMPKYHVVSAAVSDKKAGEDYTGDYYSFCKVENGSYMTVVSDGMGSGPEAGKESKLTVELVEKFLESGFDEKCAVDTINTVMAMKFEEDEKFTTLDLNTIDTYTGSAKFIKIGATTSFIKRGKTVKAIESKMPPFGLVDSIDLEEVKVDLKEGDMIITVSDGVIDIDKRNVGSHLWLEDYLEHGSFDPKVMAEDILKTARALSKGVIKDDMTVVVSKVYSMY